MSTTEAVILVGHGGLATDTPRECLTEFRQLQRDRKQRGEAVPSTREAELEAEIRNWPRTVETDPYKAGLESVATKLRSRIGGRRLIAAYNEFCAPSVDEAIDQLASEGVRKVTVVPTMLTPGGSHSERDVPELLERARRRHPDIRIVYAWPFDPDRIAELIASQLDN